MNLKRFKHGEWITDYSELQTLRNGDILSNIASSKIFDVSIVDPLNRDEILAQVIMQDDDTFIRVSDTIETDLSSFHLDTPYLKLAYNTASSEESENPVKLSFYMKLNDLDNCGFIYAYDSSRNVPYSLHIIKLIDDAWLLDNTHTIKYPFNYNEWIKFEMEFVADHVKNDIVPCVIKINDCAIGVINWLNIHRFPLRLYLNCSNHGYIDLKQIKVERICEKTLPEKTLIKITREDEDNIAVLTANILSPVIQDDEEEDDTNHKFRIEFTNLTFGQYINFAATSISGLDFYENRVTDPKTDIIKVYRDSDGNEFPIHIYAVPRVNHNYWDSNSLVGYYHYSYDTRPEDKIVIEFESSINNINAIGKIIHFEALEDYKHGDFKLDVYVDDNLFFSHEREFDMAVDVEIKYTKARIKYTVIDYLDEFTSGMSVAERGTI